MRNPNAAFEQSRSLQNGAIIACGVSVDGSVPATGAESAPGSTNEIHPLSEIHISLRSTPWNGNGHGSGTRVGGSLSGGVSVTGVPLKKPGPTCAPSTG